MTQQKAYDGSVFRFASELLKDKPWSKVSCKDTFDFESLLAAATDHRYPPPGSRPTTIATSTYYTGHKHQDNASRRASPENQEKVNLQ